MPHMVARPKRKRAEVSYVEPLDSFEAVVDGDDKVLSEDEFARQKKTTVSLTFRHRRASV